MLFDKQVNAMLTVMIEKNWSLFLLTLALFLAKMVMVIVQLAFIKFLIIIWTFFRFPIYKGNRIIKCPFLMAIPLTIISLLLLITYLYDKHDCTSYNNEIKLPQSNEN